MSEGFNRTMLLAGIFVLSLILSFLFSGMEAGVFVLNRWRIRQQMKAGKKAARVLHGYLENAENFLWTILIGNTLANFIAIGWMAGGLYWLLDERWIAVPLFLLGVLLFYTFCDLLPKMLFRQFPNRLCMAAAVPFRMVHLMLSPLVVLAEWFANALLQVTGGKVFTGHVFGSRSELRLFMQQASEGLTSEERRMISRVLDLQKISVASVTRPFLRVRTITVDMSAGNALEIFRQESYARIPVWQTAAGGRRRIAGILSLDSLLYGEEISLDMPVQNLLKPALFLSQDLLLDEALRRMQQQGHRVAVVVGRNGQEVGIVSLRDVLEVIFGEVSHYAA